MTTEIIPIIGDWYKNTAGEVFEVVAHDAAQGLIEIQHFDGMVEELDADSWNEMELFSVEPPEDWSGSLDIERQDYGVDLEESQHLDWSNPIDMLDV